jgi:hypothetical protein
MAKLILNRAQILGANDLRFEDVSVPEWAPEFKEDGVTPFTEDEKKEVVVRVRNLSGVSRGNFIKHTLDLKAKEDNKEKADFEIEMLLVAMTAIDEQGEQLFTLDDIRALGQKSADPISRAAEVASRLSGLDKGAKEKAVKN